MNIKVKSLSFILTIMLLSVGCGSNSSSENKEFKDARNLVKSLGKYSASSRTTNAQAKSLGEDEGFVVKDDYDFVRPLAIDIKGNIEEGGILEFFNQEGHRVEIESKSDNKVAIKVDLDGDGVFSNNEIIFDKFDPIEVIASKSDIDSIYGSDLEEKMKIVSDSEEILVRIDLVEPNYIYPIEIQSVGNSTGGANMEGGEVTYFYNGKEVTKEEMDQIQERYQENERKRSLYRAKVNKENIEEFLLANNISENDSIKNAIEAGFSHFELSLTKQEIKDLVDANKDWIYAVTLPPTIAIDATLY